MFAKDKEAQDMLSLGEVADLLGVSSTTVRRWIEAGEIHAKKSSEVLVKPRWLVSREEVERFRKSKLND